MIQEKIPRSVGTHNGTFHADEVTACALLCMFDCVDEKNIFRTRDTDLLSKCEYVCDVGGIYDPKRKFFDHHQTDYQGPLSSAGMILLYLKDQGTMDESAYNFLNQAIILGVDAHDNGKDPQIPGLCTYSHVIANYTPVPFDVEDSVVEKCFFEAFHFALSYLQRIWKRHQYIQSCRAIVEEKMEKKEVCLFFEKRIPWLELFFELGGEAHPAEFVIMPEGKHWKLRGIPPNYQHRMDVRTPLPEEWAGLLDEELKQISGISGAIFCHKGRFISVWETKEDAIKALQLVLERKTERA